MSNTTPTNYKAWRRLDWTLLVVFALNILWSNNALTAKGGVEDWFNWVWVIVSLWGTCDYWEKLFGKRGK